MNTIVELIQFALAPVFLLTGIAGFLGVLSNRLNNIVDRARELEDRFAVDPKSAGAGVRRQVVAFVRRARLTNLAMSLCVVSALFVMVAIGALFLSAYLHSLPVLPIALVFAASLGALLAGLLCFLREVYLATESLQTDIE